MTGSVRALPWADGAVTIGALVRTEINTALCGASHTAVAVVWWMVVRSVEIRRAGDERETRRELPCSRLCLVGMPGMRAELRMA